MTATLGLDDGGMVVDWLTLPEDPIEPDTPCAEVCALFDADARRRAILVAGADGGPPTIISRGNFFSRIAPRPGDEATGCGDRSLGELLDEQPVVAPAAMAVGEAAREALEGDPRCEAVIVAFDDGRHGTVRVVDLFKLMGDVNRVAEETARSRLRDLQIAQAELVQAQKLESVGQLAAGIAHEINTPMQYIGDNAHFLKATVQRLLAVADAAEAAVADGGSEAEREALAAVLAKSKVGLLKERAPKAAEDALAGVENVSRIVTAMKRFSHPGSDEFEPLDLNEAISTTVTVARNEWKYNAEVVTDFAEGLPMIEGRLGPLNQVWLNMIVNATHAIADAHGGAKGTITIGTALVDDGASVEVTIADDGAGIAPENLTKVFDHFFTTKEVGKGTGQGLSIAHQVVVAEHQGRLDVDSTVGEGTTFTITLPITQTSSHPDGDPAEAEAGS